MRTLRDLNNEDIERLLLRGFPSTVATSPRKSSVVYIKRDIDDPVTRQPAVIRGYAALYNVISTATFERGLPEVLAVHSFDDYLKSGKTPQFVFNHQGYSGLMSDSVRLWSDDTGLAFEATNIKYTDQNEWIIRMIARGLLGCSWRVPAGTWESSNRSIELVDGAAMWVVRSVPALVEIGPSVNPTYNTGCWLSSADPNRMPIHLWRLADAWRRSL